MHGRQRTTHLDSPDGPGAGGLPKRLVHLLGLLCVAQLMVILDISAVNVALPPGTSAL